MLKESKLQQECEEVRKAVDDLLITLEESGYVYDCHDERHESKMYKLREKIDSFTEAVIDAEGLSHDERSEYITTLTIANNIEGFALGTYSAINAEGNWIYLTWNPLDEVN